MRPSQALDLQHIALSHGSFKVDLDIVWATVTSDLPELKAKLALLTS